MAETVGPWADFQPAQSGGPWEDFQPQAPAPTNPVMGALDSVGLGNVARMAVNDIKNLPGRIYGGLESAFTLPGDIYQGKAVVPQSANMPGGEDTSAIGRVTSLASIAPVGSIGGGAMRVVPSGDQLKTAAQAGYQQAENIPIALKPQAAQIMGRNIKQLLPDPLLAPKTHGILDRLAHRDFDSPLTARDLRTTQRDLGDIKNYNSDPTERFAAGRASSVFNNALEGLDGAPSALAQGTPADAAQFSQLVREANGNWAAHQEAKEFNQRITNAQYRTNQSNSGMNLENNLRSQATQILEHPNELRGLDDDTIQALKDYNAGSRTANVMRRVGNLLGGGGGLGMLASGAAGHLMGLPDAAGPLAGYISKSIGNRLALAKAKQIEDMMRANSPLGRQGITAPIPFNPLGTMRTGILGLSPPNSGGGQ